MDRPFTRRDIEQSDQSVINHGRWGNADLLRYTREDGDWIVKDFSHCPWPIRHTWGAFMVRRELLALNRLQGINGVSSDAFRMDRFALCYRYMSGTTLRACERSHLSSDFFKALERLVRDMHSRNVAHMDLRYRRNIMVREDGSPGLIDFQAHVRLEHMPAGLRGLLESVDLAGVYKHWSKCAPDTLDKNRRSLLRTMNRRRGYWLLRGYGLRLKRRRRQRYEHALLNDNGRESAR